MDKQGQKTSVLRNLAENLCKLRANPLKNNFLLGLKVLSYTLIKYAYKSIAYKLLNRLKNASTHFLLIGFSFV